MTIFQETSGLFCHQCALWIANAEPATLEWPGHERRSALDSRWSVNRIAKQDTLDRCDGCGEFSAAVGMGRYHCTMLVEEWQPEELADITREERDAFSGRYLKANYVTARKYFGHSFPGEVKALRALAVWAGSPGHVPLHAILAMIPERQATDAT